MTDTPTPSIEPGLPPARIQTNPLVSISFSLREVGAEDALLGWLCKFGAGSSCHIIEVAYFLRAKLPLGQSNLASGRGLIYQQSNLIFSVWTKCNSVPVSSP